MEAALRFQGKTALVTGAAVGGMGQATAFLFAREGANVIVADVDAKAAADTATAIRATGGAAKACQVDLRDRSQVFEMVEDAVDTFGALEVLANVAGLYPHAPLADTTEDFWDGVFAVDLKGPLFTCQAALPHMAEHGGAIINVASGAAFYAIHGLGAYSAAKAGLVAMSRVLALESPPNVRVNVVIPGSTATQRHLTEPTRTGMIVDPSTDLPLTERWLQPSQIAEVIVWAASPDAAAVNGALIRVGARKIL